MTGAETLDVARDAIFTLIIVSAPVMLVGLAVGLAISLVQALTQIQEMTISFVPKILAIFISLLVALPFMAEKLHGQMLRIASHIITRLISLCASTSASCRLSRPLICWCLRASAP